MILPLLLSSWTIFAGLAFLSVVLLQFLLASSRRGGEGTSSEARRRIQHVVTGQVLVAISYILPLYCCIGALFIGLTSLVYVRFVHDEWYRTTFRRLLRPYELHYGVLPGAAYFLMGTALVALFFPLPLAQYSILCLSWADPMAAWVGSAIPSPKLHDTASLAGCIACFVTASLVGFAWLDENVSTDAVILGALVCTIVEALPSVNDNLVIPVATAAAVKWAMSLD